MSYHSEFASFSNEILFEVVQRQPNLLIKGLTANKDDLSIQTILSELENPVHDGFDLREIIDKVSVIEEYEEMKNRVVQSLNVALGKMEKQ